MGGWGKIENKDHLSPAKAEIRAELGKNNLKSEFEKYHISLLIKQ